MVTVSPVKGRFFFFFSFPLDRNGKVFWFLRREFEGGEIWDKRKGGVAHIGVYLIIFFFLFFSFILHEILYKAYHLGLCAITF